MFAMNLERSAARLARLTELQLKVARRADELARAGGWGTNLNLGCWLQAELEILPEHIEDFAPAKRAPLAQSA